MAASVHARLAGEEVELFADRGLYWPARRRMLVADLHLGKADVFRRAGIGVPRGGTSHDLARLSRLLDASGASELWVLGDVVHGAVNDTSWQESWRQWRVRHPQVSIAAVVGNHDRALANAGLGFELLGEEVDDGPFALRHHPGAHASRHVLAGHLHPAVRLPGMQGRRWPVFWLRGSHTVLPAFSEFTGSFVVEPAGSERVAICVEGEVVWLAAAGKPAGQAGLR